MFVVEIERRWVLVVWGWKCRDLVRFPSNVEIGALLIADATVFINIA